MSSHQSTDEQLAQPIGKPNGDSGLPIEAPPPPAPATDQPKPCECTCQKNKQSEPPADTKMSCKNKVCLGFIFLFQLLGLICALWYVFEPVREFIHAIGEFFSQNIPLNMVDPQRGFVGLLLVIFVENSLSQIMVDFYTGKNKPRISAACRFLPIMLGIIAYAQRL